MQLNSAVEQATLNRYGAIFRLPLKGILPLGRRSFAMAEKTDSFSSIDNAPLVELDITFPHSSPNARLLLPAPASDADGVGLRNAGNAPGASIELDDKVSWESGVDAADKLDYLIAASSGVISGLVDVLWVGDFSLDRASTWGRDQIDRFVIKVAQSEGYKGDDLAGAIRKLEENHPFAADGSADVFGGGLQHHLRDFSHSNSQEPG